MVEMELDLRSSQEGEAMRELKLTCMGNLLGASKARVYRKDLHSRFLLVSAGCIATPTPGHFVEELIGKTDVDFCSEEHAQAFEDEQQIIRTGEPMVGKLERKTFRDRANAWVSTSKMPLRDERPLPPEAVGELLS